MNERRAAFQLAVVIGRFQPFHFGHLALLEHALEIAPRALLVLGSAPGPRMVKNPFTAAERIEAIRASLSPEQRARVGFATVRDYYDEPRWAGAVKAVVTGEANAAAGRGASAADASETNPTIALVGFRKDESSSYLSLFPEWQEVALPRQAPIDGTALRRSYFTELGAELPPELMAAVPDAVAQFLLKFRATPYFAQLREELLTLDANRQKYGNGPFVTVDALVTCAEHVLLVQRGHAPGKGLWALPGGFLESSERLLTAAIRELREETELPCSAQELRAVLRGVHVFDHPQRSQRGRTLTHAHYFALENDSLPPVRGADDAVAARWLPITEAAGMLEMLCEDHYQIIDHFLKISRD